VEHKNLRILAVALVLGSLLGCALSVSRVTRSDEEQKPPLIGETGKARYLAPLAVPPCEDYGAPYVHTRLHPVSVAAAMTLFSVFGLSVFPARRVPASASADSSFPSLIAEENDWRQAKVLP
jgi:hypothetical protein